MSIGAWISQAVANAAADKELQESAARFAAERIDTAISTLVGAAQAAYDRRGFRFCERYLRAAFLRDHWSGVSSRDLGNKRARRLDLRWSRRALRWQARCIAAPPVRVGTLWVSPCEVMKVCRDG